MKIKDFVPAGDRVLMLQAHDDEKTKGGIIIPEVLRGKMMYGKVLAVGPTVEHTEKGQLVYVGRYSGVELEFEGEKYLVVLEKDIVGYMNGQH